MAAPCRTLPQRNLWWTLAVIFVTVGNAVQSFRRLIEAVDRIARSDALAGHEIIVQSGNSSNAHVDHCILEPFLPLNRFLELIDRANIVICHAGNGTLMHVLRAGKIPVVMPRLKQFNEHVDDHQLDLVKLLTEEGRIIPAYDVVDLPAAIDAARHHKSIVRPLVLPPLIKLVKQAIEDLDRKR